MIFQHTLNPVLEKRKNQTRRVIKPNEIALRGRNNKIEAVACNGREKWRIGKTYAVQPARGKGQVAQIRLIAINSEQVTRISTADAIAEGFASRQEFFATWRAIHGDHSFDLRVWVLKFELIRINVNMDGHIIEEHMLSRCSVSNSRLEWLSTI